MEEGEDQQEQQERVRSGQPILAHDDDPELAGEGSTAVLIGHWDSAIIITFLPFIMLGCGYWCSTYLVTFTFFAILLYQQVSSGYAYGT